ncbi:MAG: nucleotidyltransferase domain-containing protein [Verrucomicrobiota bacterium]
MKEKIVKVIHDLESEADIRILHACETGSRAWGFASPDSDYDIRLIYTHPKNWYLGLKEKKDFIDRFLPGDLDLVGWDLRKALRLFYDCNLSLNERLGSPEVYYSVDGFDRQVTAMVARFFNPRKAMHHYLSMAKKVYAQNNDKGRIGIKKLFYVVRPLFCCSWIERNNSMPPTVFQDLLDEGLAPNDLIEAICAIRKQKETAMEGHVTEIPQILQQWIGSEITRFEKSSESLSGSQKKSWQDLDQLFLDWL